MGLKVPRFGLLSSAVGPMLVALQTSCDGPKSPSGLIDFPNPAFYTISLPFIKRMHDAGREEDDFAGG